MAKAAKVATKRKLLEVEALDVKWMVFEQRRELAECLVEWEKVVAKVPEVAAFEKAKKAWGWPVTRPTKKIRDDQLHAWEQEDADALVTGAKDANEWEPEEWTKWQWQQSEDVWDELPEVLPEVCTEDGEDGEDAERFFQGQEELGGMQ